MVNLATRVNNCVGENNQKYFILFAMYVPNPTISAALPSLSLPSKPNLLRSPCVDKTKCRGACCCRAFSPLLFCFSGLFFFLSFCPFQVLFAFVLIFESVCGALSLCTCKVHLHQLRLLRGRGRIQGLRMRQQRSARVEHAVLHAVCRVLRPASCVLRVVSCVLCG